MSESLDIESLYKTHFAHLHRVAIRVVNDSDAANDVVQDVFISVWKNKDSITIGTTMEGYLVKSTVNKAINYLEKNRRHLKVSITDQNEFSEGMAAFGENDFDYELFQGVVYQVLDSLPPKCRAIFNLSRFEDMKYKEIAEHLDISIKTVENQMSIAIKKLNSELKPRLKNNFPEIFIPLFLIFFQIL